MAVRAGAEGRRGHKTGGDGTWVRVVKIWHHAHLVSNDATALAVLTKQGGIGAALHVQAKAETLPPGETRLRRRPGVKKTARMSKHLSLVRLQSDRREEAGRLGRLDGVDLGRSKSAVTGSRVVLI
eukprot:3467667-Prymnesium_polylepis.2